MVNGYNYDTRQKKGVKNIRQAAGSEQKVVTIYRKWRDFYVRYCIKLRGQNKQKLRSKIFFFFSSFKIPRRGEGGLSILIN